MFNVFSNYLTPLKEAKIVELTEENKPSEIFNQLRIAYNQGVKGIEYCTRFFLSNSEEDEELFEYIHQNHKLMDVVRWTNRNITTNLVTADYRSIHVYLRIACSMLVNLKETGKLREEMYFKLHSNLAQNVLNAISEVYTEDLPF